MRFPFKLDPTEDFNGCWALSFVDTPTDMNISDPTLSSCGRFSVDSLEEYGVTHEQAAWLIALNDGISDSAFDALNSLCAVVQEKLGVTTGDFAAMYFSDGKLLHHMQYQMCRYALAELEDSAYMQPKAWAPSADQLAAIKVFKEKYSNPERLRGLGCKDWKEALQVAWHSGWDAKVLNGYLLRQLRNTPEAQVWLETYEG